MIYNMPELHESLFIFRHDYVPCILWYGPTLSALKRRNVPGEKVYTEAPITMFAYCSIAGDVSIVLNQCINTV